MSSLDLKYKIPVERGDEINKIKIKKVKTPQTLSIGFYW
jgi:hypothetical protein